MSDLKEDIIDRAKALILPEFSKLQKGTNEICIRQETLEKQMVMVGENVFNNSRWIDELSKMVDTTNQWNDGTERLYIETENIKKEMGRIRRKYFVTAVIHNLKRGYC